MEANVSDVAHKRTDLGLCGGFELHGDGFSVVLTAAEVRVAARQVRLQERVVYERLWTQRALRPKEERTNDFTPWNFIRKLGHFTLG